MTLLRETPATNALVTSTDKDWEQFALADPYFAVWTDERFKSDQLNVDTRRLFFEAGEQLINHVFETLRVHFDAPARFGVALDFGCGVGRLLLPLAKRSSLAIGVDVSETMLQICRQNARAAELDNVELYSGSDALRKVSSPLDLVTSFVVFQHIPPRIGYARLRELLKLVKVGGFGYLHITYANEIHHIGVEAHTPGVSFGYYQRLDNQVVKLMETSVDEPPQMQMNHYHLNEVMAMLWDNGVTQFFANQTNHGGCLGLELFLRKDGTGKA